MSHLERLKDFYVTLLLLGTSAIIVAGYKLFNWTLFLADPRITLESISALLSFGGALAFFLGPVIILKLGIQRSTALAFGASVVGIALVWLVFPIHMNFVWFVIAGLVVWFGGALWLVTKNILLPSIIHDTGLKDTLVTGVANIVFVIATLVGTVGGSYLAEVFHIDGVSVLGFLGLISLALFGTLEEARHKNPFGIHEYVQGVKKIVVEFHVPIIVTATLWAVITAMAQIFIEVGVHAFHLSFTNASLVLVWATLGGIVGNILSMPLQPKRWKYYRIFLTSLGMLIFLSTWLVDLIKMDGSVIMLNVLAVAIGTVFWAAVNLMEWYYFLELESSRFKAFGAAVYGLFASAAIFILMQGLSLIRMFEHHVPFFLCTACIVGLLYLSRNLRDEVSK